MRIVEGRRLDHVVLLVAAQAVLRAECSGEFHAGGGERIERVSQIRRDGSGMRQQRDALALQLTTQRLLVEQPIDTELHEGSPARRQGKAIAMMKVGLAWRMRQRPIGNVSLLALDDGGHGEPQPRGP